MEKKIKWTIVDSNEKLVSEWASRKLAREVLKEYNEWVLEDFMNDLTYPLKIVREEWNLVSKKVVR